MTIAELKNQRNKLMVDAGALAKNLTDETRSKFDSIMKDADALSADITRLEAVAKHEAEIRSANRPPREGFEKRGPSADNAENVELEKRAFREFLRYGSTRSDETRDLLTTGNAGTTIPVGFDPVLHVAEKNYGAITTAVSRLNTETGEPISVSLVDDTANGLQLVGEGTVASEVDPSFNPRFQSSVDLLTTGSVRISNSLLLDSQFDLDNFIGTAMATRYYRGLSKAVTTGLDSVGTVLPNMQVLRAPVGTTTASAAAGVGYQDLVNLFGSVDAAYANSPTACFVMSSATRANLMGLTIQTGAPLLQTDPVTQQPFSSLFGKPIVISEYTPGVVAGNAPILFGDLKQAYVLRTVGNFGVKRLNELGALADETIFIMFARAGGYNLLPGSAVPVKSIQIHS